MRTWRVSSTRMPFPKESRRFRLLVIAGTGVLLLVLAAVSLCSGSASIPLDEVIRALFGGDQTEKFYQIVQFVRLPRTLAAILAGGALAVAGAILQAVLGNALASPNIIGVNAGAGLFTILLAAFFPQFIWFTPLAAFLGALAAALLVYLLAQKTGASRMTILLSGIAVSSFLGAVTDGVITLVPDTQAGRFAFLIGGFSGVSMDSLKLASLCILIGIGAALLFSYDLNVLTLGEETASTLGMRAGLTRMVFLILAALLAGSAISFAGLLGFVGLIVPHAARFFVGQDHRYLLPLCALLGGAFTLLCDLLARVLFAPFELPVGIVLSFLGAPFFLYLLFKQKRGRLHD